MTFDETRASAFRMVFKDIPFSYGDFKIASAYPICCVRSTIKFCASPASRLTLLKNSARSTSLSQGR